MKITALVVKRTDVLINGFKYYAATTQKEEILNFATIRITLKILVLRGNTCP